MRAFLCGESFPLGVPDRLCVHSSAVGHLRVHRYEAMATRKHNRGTTLLVILQVWILPCHGFTYTPYGLGSSSSSSAGAWSPRVAARQSSVAAMHPRPPKAAAAVSRGTLPSLSMVDGGGEPFDPYADEVRCCVYGYYV